MIFTPLPTANSVPALSKSSHALPARSTNSRLTASIAAWASFGSDSHFWRFIATKKPSE